MALATPVSAHLGHRSYCAGRTGPGGLDVTVEVLVRQLAENPDGTQGPFDDATILASADRHRQNLEAHVRATTPAGECKLTSNGPRLADEASRRGVFELSFACPAGPVTFSSDYREEMHADAEMVCALDGAAHVFRKGANDFLVGTPPSLGKVLGDFVRLGSEHVFGGIDHVLFVLSLLLGAASAMAKEPGRTLRRVVGLVTGFTLGHSITLIVAALGIMSLPSRLTESLIALSIVVVAVHNLLAESPRGRTFTSALFGLIHGFGFASALAEVGLPARATVPALLAFNVGIELAQLAVVLLCFPLLSCARRQAWFRKRLLWPACLGIALLAFVWFVKRALSLDVLSWLGG